MKSLKQIYKFAFVLPAILFAGCSDDNEPAPSTGADAFEVPSELTLTLSVPDEEVVNLGTRAGDPAISSVTVFCYDNTGTTGRHLEHTTLTSGWTSAAGGYQITVPIHKLTKSVHLVVNATVAGNATDPAAIVSTNADAGIMWGRADLKDIITKGAKITMVRNTAKVSVTAEAAGFSFSGFAVTGTSDRGTVAPAGWNLNPTTPSVASGASALTTAVIKGSSAEIRVFETEADSPKSGTTEQFVTRGRVIIEGTYQGVKGYYPVAFRKRTGTGGSEGPSNYHYTPIPVIRNHHYVVAIKEVRAQGWPTIADAMTAEPDNRLTVEITDKTPDITDIIATRDYLLGVNPEVAAASYDQPSVELEFVTSWSGNGGKRYELTSSASWAKVAQATQTAETIVDMETDRNVSGYQYKVSVPLDANSNSTAAREATITVRSGELVRTITITQPGRDYKRDPNRKVSVSGMPGLSSEYSSDWFKFVDEVCQGMRQEDNYGNVVLNEGLHFPAVPAYTLVYSIPKLAGDQSATITEGDSYFSVTTSGSTYTVQLKSPSNIQIVTGKLRITNSAGAQINYDLYRTGYIHQLTSSTETYQREDEKITGWFYYGVVNVGNQYILDRNLGASSNAPYISTYAGFSNNKRAIGAYFKVATEKAPKGDEYNYNDVKDSPSTIINNLAVSRFEIPNESQITNWHIEVENVSGTSGESSRVATINTSGGKIFIPHGGYYEATSQKFETHANIWTRTLLSGNQGFDPDLSPEFGFWYRYLDVYGIKVNFGQMRFANGSGGTAPTANSVYKYMPIRLVWNN